MSSNYPPGVTGREFAIAGSEREVEMDLTCGDCGWTGPEIVSVYSGQAWWACPEFVPAHGANPMPVSGRITVPVGIGKSFTSWGTVGYTCAHCTLPCKSLDDIMSEHPATGGCGHEHTFTAEEFERIVRPALAR